MPKSYMPPCSRVLLLIMAACVLCRNGVIQLAHSNLAVGDNIEIGNLTSEAAEVISAVAKLSDGPYQQGWWKLANTHWHDSAILRFFSEGPADMQKLAKVSGQSDSWNKSQIKSLTGQTDLMLALQNHSTASYQMSRTIDGTGTIEASLWMLVFRCISASSCNDGYFVPMVAVPGGTSAEPDDDVFQYSYHSLWLKLTTNLIVNAIPSFIAKLPQATRVPVADDVDDPELSVVVNVYPNFPECPSTVIRGYRSLLDASYGLVPGSACIEFGELSLKLLVSLALFFDNATDPRDIQLSTLEDFFSLLQINTTQWKTVPFEECAEAGVLVRSSQNPESLKLCNQEICVGNANCSTEGVQRLRSLNDNLVSKSCTNISTEGSCQMSCNGAVDAHSIKLIPQSHWISTEGNNTSEFSQAPSMTDFNASSMCIRTPSPLSPFFLSKTTQAAFLQAVRIRATTYLHSFIAEHNIAFMTIKGPATQFQSFVALIVSTAISVIMTISGAFTNFLLSIICRKWPRHLDSQHMSRVRNVGKVSFQIMCNVLLCFLCFLPVMYMGWSELDREKPFYTWDLGSNDQLIFNSFGSETQLRVVYLLSAKSKYRSHFITASTLVVSITSVIAAVCAAKRCKEVFDRYTLLAAGDDPLKGDSDTLILVRDLKAIEMTNAEYLDMTTEMNGNYNVRMQELAQTAMNSQPSDFSDPAAKTARFMSHRTSAVSCTVHSPQGTRHTSPTSPFFVGYTPSV